MDKTISIVEDWLNECYNDEDSEYLLRSIENEQDHLIHALFTLWDEKTRYDEVFENAIKQAFIFSKSKDGRLREFVFYFIPSFIYIYLTAISTGDKKSVCNLEYTLLALYNKEVLDDQGAPRVASFRLPTLARQSIYHDPASLAPASYTPDSLQRLEAGDAETVRWGPPRHIDVVTAATRYHLVTGLLVAFNAKLSKFPKIVLMHLCKSSSKIVCQGFSRQGHHHRSSYGSDSSFGVYPRPIPRIPVTSDLLTELAHSIYFAMFNDFASLGIQSLEDIHMRAQYELFADVLLMTNAIKNSLKVNQSGQQSDDPMGISIALTPATSTVALSKTYITNASFRTKKLPDDIPIQRIEAGLEASAKGLKSIYEENDVDDGSKPIRPLQGSGREIKEKSTKLSSNIPLPSIVKKRDKNKNGDRRDSDKKLERDRKSKERDSNNRSSLTITTSNSDGMITASPLGDSMNQPQFEMKSFLKGSSFDGNLKDSTAKLSNSSDSRIEEVTLLESKTDGEINGETDTNHIGSKLL